MPFATSIKFGGVVFSGPNYPDPVLLNISGTWGFMLDSLTAGAGSLKAPPYWLLQFAKRDNRMRRLWVRTAKVLSPASDTSIAWDGTSITTEVPTPLKWYLPQHGLHIPSGTLGGELVTMVPWQNEWATARVYFIRQPGGGSFNVTTPATGPQSVSTDGAEGEIGYVEVTNDTGTANTSLKLGGWTGGDICIAGFLLDTGHTGQDYLDIINFATAGRESGQYNAYAMQPWYEALGVERMYMNIGANDVSQGIPTTQAEFATLVDTCLASGMTAQDLLLVRPNDVARELDGLWEELRDNYNIPFTSILRLWGNLSDFNSNGWMADGDNVHPNDQWNEMFAQDLYIEGKLVNMHNALTLGTNPQWMTSLLTQTYIVMDSTLSLIDDFDVDVVFYFGGSRNTYLFASSANTDDYCYVETSSSNKLKVRINDVTKYSVNPIPVGWNWINLKRASGSSAVTITVNGAVDSTQNISTADWPVGLLTRTTQALSVSGMFAWFDFKDQNGRHLYLLNQSLGVDQIVPLEGTIGAAWQNKPSERSYTDRYTIVGDNLINYDEGKIVYSGWQGWDWPT